LRRTIALTLLLATLTASSGAQAQEFARCDDRLHSVQLALDGDVRWARFWYWAWMAAGTGLLGGQAALAAVTHGNTQKEYIAGAATSVFIPAVLLVHPPTVLVDAPALDARIQQTSVGGRVGDPCIAVSRAQELLRQDAADEALRTAWYAHTFVIAGNFAVGLFLGLAFHDWFGAAKQAFGGSAVGELQILTTPTGALRAQGLGLAGSF
jgi:hypothetical protein